MILTTSPCVTYSSATSSSATYASTTSLNATSSILLLVLLSLLEVLRLCYFPYDDEGSYWSMQRLLELLPQVILLLVLFLKEILALVLLPLMVYFFLWCWSMQLLLVLLPLVLLLLVLLFLNHEDWIHATSTPASCLVHKIQY